MWVFSENAQKKSSAMGVGSAEIEKAIENPDWVYISTVYSGANVAVSERLAVVYDPTNLIVLSLSWRDRPKR